MIISSINQFYFNNQILINIIKKTLKKETTKSLINASKRHQKKAYNIKNKIKLIHINTKFYKNNYK